MSSGAPPQNPPGTPVPKRHINVRNQRSLPALPFSFKNRPDYRDFNTGQLVLAMPMGTLTVHATAGRGRGKEIFTVYTLHY